MDISSLQKILIFQDMNEKEIEDALTTLSAFEKKYKKNSTIFHAGKITDSMGLVVAGSVIIESNDIWGNRTILSHIGKGDFFAETYALLDQKPMLVDVKANEECHILFIRLNMLKQLHSLKSSWAVKILKNLLRISLYKNLTLSSRSFHTSPKTIRGRVLAYLNSIALEQGKKEFDIPFNRQQLADYLNIERTSLSKELGKMQRDDIISVKGNHFKIHFSQDN